MKKYNVGIVGCGWAATAHIPAINATTLGQATADRSVQLGRPVKLPLSEE